MHHWFGRSFEEWLGKQARGVYPDGTQRELYATDNFVLNAEGCLPLSSSYESLVLLPLVKKMMQQVPFHSQLRQLGPSPLGNQKDNWFIERVHTFYYFLNFIVSPTQMPLTCHLHDPSDISGLQINSREEFDEEYYLDNNPDVARLVEKGLIPNGLVHFYKNYPSSKHRPYRFSHTPSLWPPLSPPITEAPLLEVY